MPDATSRLGGPDRKRDREKVADKNAPADPGSLAGKFGEGEQCHQGKDSGGIDHRRSHLGPAGMLAQRVIAGLIEIGLDGAVKEGIPRGLARLHDQRHGPGAADDGQKARGQRSPTVEKNPDQDRKRCHDQTDDRHMIEREMKMGGGKK